MNLDFWELTLCIPFLLSSEHQGQNLHGHNKVKQGTLKIEGFLSLCYSSELFNSPIPTYAWSILKTTTTTKPLVILCRDRKVYIPSARGQEEGFLYNFRI